MQPHHLTWTTAIRPLILRTQSAKKFEISLLQITTHTTHIRQVEFLASVLSKFQKAIASLEM